jgi:ElaB/YqjD/DUF883 family membrane-anchored ribosome-binding protein
MDQKPNLSALRPEQIRHQVERTRSELTTKLEAIEHKIRDTVADARSAVVDTVETVRHSVDHAVRAVNGSLHSTVDSVKHAIDPVRQVERRPWTMLAASVAAGYVLGCVAPRRRPVNRTVFRTSEETFLAHAGNGGRRPESNGVRTIVPPTSASVVKSGVPERGFIRQLTENFAPEIQQIKRLALGSAMNFARNMITQSIAPPLGPELAAVMDRLTTTLGGVPLGGRVPECPTERAYATNKAGR